MRRLEMERKRSEMRRPYRRCETCEWSEQDKKVSSGYWCLYRDRGFNPSYRAAVISDEWCSEWKSDGTKHCKECRHWKLDENNRGRCAMKYGFDSYSAENEDACPDFEEA